ncbi:CidA/LrgA family protein [Litchfieldia salsa]|uniref:Holin-like protein n=1 Tax=Litchfieldia salsa TaxID=930152 RepID=A0A1H0VKG9_9BACI|nr:CidA/LrgA family protein [Litchfieldia salsa]SDP79089.1 holin-like protein [Litchfieldia salsa]
MRNMLFILLQLFILTVIYTGSNYIVKLTHLPIPGNVLGMIILYVCLIKRIIKVEYIEKAALYLIKHLALFFVPFAVGLMNYGDLILMSGFQLLVMIVGSTVIGLAVTSGLTQYLSAKEAHKHERSRSNSI